MQPLRGHLVLRQGLEISGALLTMEGHLALHGWPWSHEAPPCPAHLNNPIAASVTSIRRVITDVN